MLVCYFLPVGAHLKFKYSSIKNPQVASLIKKSTVAASPITSPKSSLIDSDNDLDSKGKGKEKRLSVLEVMASDQEYVIDKDYGSEKRRRKEFIAFAVIGTILIIYAIFVLVL